MTKNIDYRTQENFSLENFSLPPLKDKLNKRFCAFKDMLESLIEERVIDSYHFGNISGDMKNELIKLDVTFDCNKYVTYVVSFKATVYADPYTQRPIDNLLSMHISSDDLKNKIIKSKECFEYGHINETKAIEIFEKFSDSPINSLETSGFKISQVKHASEYADRVKKHDVALILVFMHEEYRISLRIGVQIKSSKKRQNEHQKRHGDVPSFVSIPDESIEKSFSRLKKLFSKIVEMKKILLTKNGVERYIPLTKEQKRIFQLKIRQLELTLHM